MDEVVKMVVDRTGISEDKARMAVDVVVNYLKSKAPGALSGQIDAALTGGGKVSDILGGKFGGV